MLGITVLSLRTSETIYNCLLDAMVSGEKFTVPQMVTPLHVAHHLSATDLNAEKQRRAASLALCRQEKASLGTCLVHTCCKVLGFIIQCLCR